MLWPLARALTCFRCPRLHDLGIAFSGYLAFTPVYLTAGHTLPANDLPILRIPFLGYCIPLSLAHSTHVA